jgi:hypothetical protein
MVKPQGLHDVDGSAAISSALMFLIAMHPLVATSGV